jgi:hypothetical protein
MIHGVTGKTQVALDHLYAELEEKWPQKNEMERRFRHCMDELDRTIGEKISTSMFKNRAAFYGLFCATYNLIYKGLPLSKKAKQIALPTSFKAKVLKIGEKIYAKTAPEKVLDALARRTTNIDSRKAVLKYFDSALARG